MDGIHLIREEIGNVSQYSSKRYGIVCYDDERVVD